MIQNEKASTKDRILRESLRLFADRGYEATTMNEIASAVDIKAASLYAHFKGKEELFGIVLESALRSWESLVDGIFSRAESASGLEKGLNLILGDFACAMMGSIAYRFWARIYVFPPRLLSPGDRQRMIAMDRSFGERLGRFCGPRLTRAVSARDLELFSSSLGYYVMGILMYAELLDEAGARGEIRRGVAFHLKALAARKED
jgi:AcrR family transcriptional regulator